MANQPALDASATITAVNIKGSSVANIFTAVRSISFDYDKGMLSLLDAEQGAFYFPLTPVTVVTFVVAGKITTITVS